MTQLITLKINNLQSILIKNLCSEGAHFYRFDPVEIVFKNESQQYILSQNDYLMPEIERMHCYLNNAIQKKLLLSQSINYSLGYLWNEYHNRMYALPDDELMEEKWNGTQYLMLSSKEYDTWIYNKEESIILEITPTYKWHDCDPKEGEEFVSYDEWITNYKPLFIAEIDKKAAQEWLEITGKVIKEIEKSDAVFLHSDK